MFGEQIFSKLKNFGKVSFTLSFFLSSSFPPFLLLFDKTSYLVDWYVGMSQKFLSAPCPKLLILAGTDRLDKDLMIGQMQGKFQLKVLPACGHIVQEDAPEAVAKAIHEFVDRNQPLDVSAIRAKNMAK